MTHRKARKRRHHLAGTLYDLPAVVEQTPSHVSQPYCFRIFFTLFAFLHIYMTLSTIHFAFIQSALFQDLEATVKRSVLTYEHLPDVVLSRILNDSPRRRPV